MSAPLKEYVANLINFEEKKILSLTKEELKSCQDAKAFHICRKRILKKFANDEIIKRLGTIAILHVNIEAQHIVFRV